MSNATPLFWYKNYKQCECVKGDSLSAAKLNSFSYKKHGLEVNYYNCHECKGIVTTVKQISA